MAGRKSSIKNEEILKVIAMHITNFISSNIPPVSADIWKKMSQDLGGIWKPITCYNYIRGNKNGHLHRVLEEHGFEVPHRVAKEIHYSDETQSNKSANISESSYNDKEDEREDLEIFHLLLTAEEWNLIKPNDPTENRLKKYAWTSIINDAIRRRYNLPCAFNFKNSRLTELLNEDYLKFSGCCASKKCKNLISGCAKKKPQDGENLIIIIKTVDTRKNIYHERVYNNLRGEERKKIGLQLKEISAEKYVEKLTSESMQFGQDLPTNIRPNYIYRQAKMESAKIEQGMKYNEKNDVTKIIQKMYNDPQYDGAIKELGSINFFVIYFTNNQIHVYREFCRSLGENSEISIDATGKFVKKFDLFEGKKTGHIFLYTATINFNKKTIPVCQMISENHDTGLITFWLDRWLRAGIKAPSQAISDYGRAILMGMCRSFNNMSLKAYVDACFNWANNDETLRINTRPAKTLIRVDVAHVMALVSRWECLKKTSHPDVKRFYLRTVALLIDCENVKEFEDIFVLTCAVGLHPYYNSYVKINNNLISIREARDRLLKLMTKSEKNIIEIEESIANFEEREDAPEPIIIDENNNTTLTQNFIRSLIGKVEPKVQNTKLEGDANAYFLPDFIKHLERLGKEFPLWTSAAIPCLKKHASTAYQEGYFGILRRVLMANVRLPATANRFLHEHIRGIKTGTMIMSSNFKHHTHLKRNLPPSSPEQSPIKKCQSTKEDSDFFCYEDWGGLSNKIKNIPSPIRSLTPIDFDQNSCSENEVSFYEEFESIKYTSSPYRTDTDTDTIKEIKKLIKQKEQEERKIKKFLSKKTGFYFEKLLYLTTTHNKQKLNILKNGSISDPVKLDGDFYKIVNTCAFDAIVHVAYLSAIYHPKYFDWIKSSTSPILKFVENFIESGPKAAIFKQRLQLLKPHYSIDNYLISPLHPRNLDVTDSIGGVLTKMFSSAPSLLESKMCDSLSCGVSETVRAVEIVGVNHRSFGYGFEGFKNLQESIVYESKNTIKCEVLNCSGYVNRIATFQDHIWVELDVRPTLNFDLSLQCTLDDLPESLQFAHKYQLTGIIAKLKSTTMHHFISYFKKLNETGHTWFECDDLKTEISPVDSSVVVIPMAAFYIRE